MSGYLLSVVGIVLVSAILSNVLPQGKTYKTLKTVIRMACLLVVVSPVLTVFQNGESGTGSNGVFQSFFKEKVIETDQTYIDYCREKTVSTAEEKLSAELEKKFSYQIFVTIRYKMEETNLDDLKKQGEWLIVENASLFCENELSDEK